MDHRFQNTLTDEPVARNRWPEERKRRTGTGVDNGHLESLVTLTMGNTSYHCESDKGRRATGLKTDANNLIYKNKKKKV